MNWTSADPIQQVTSHDEEPNIRFQKVASKDKVERNFDDRTALFLFAFGVIIFTALVALQNILYYYHNLNCVFT